MLKFCYAIFGRDGKGKRYLTLIVSENGHVRNINLTRKDAADIFASIVGAFGLRLGNAK